MCTVSRCALWQILASKSERVLFTAFWISNNNIDILYMHMWSTYMWINSGRTIECTDYKYWSRWASIWNEMQRTTYIEGGNTMTYMYSLLSVSLLSQFSIWVNFLEVCLACLHLHQHTTRATSNLVDWAAEKEILLWQKAILFVTYKIKCSHLHAFGTVVNRN